LRFNRSISGRIEVLRRHFKVVVLTGARQTGKTTLLRALFPGHHHVTLDLPQDAALAEQAPTEFLARHPPPLLVDEVQYAPALFRHLKAVVDRSPKRGQVILTGSQRFTLMKEVSESLAGRAAVLLLEPLSCEELGEVATTFRTQHGVAALLARGFYPALWDEPTLPSVEFHRSYVATWLERDLRQLLNVGSLRDFDRFLRACAARSAQLLNKSELARDVGLAVSTVGQWLSALEASGLITILEPYFDNHTKRIVKTPKLYFNDVGLLCFLLGLDARSAGQWAGFGSLWETFVFGELLKWREAHRPEAKLWFYRDKDGLEVDFLVEQGGRLDLIDAKSTELPEARDTRQVQSAAKVLGARVGAKALVTPTTKGFPLGEAVVWSGWSLSNSLTAVP
jgi:hypothetical protein